MSGSAEKPSRLASLDALRGFDMLWIVGADAFGGAFRQWDAGPAATFLGRQFEHSSWEGFTFYDLIFPLFIFMVGVAIPFSLGRIQETGGKVAAFRRIVRRALLMYVLGLVYYGGFVTTPDGQFRLMGVLQRLALCYFFASVLFMTLRPRALLAVCAGLLVGYWALMTFVAVPGFGAGDYAEGHNLANWVDREFLAGYKRHGDHDPEGLLSTLPAIASCLIGVFAGLWIKDRTQSDARKLAGLAIAGVVMLVLGHLWALQFPVIKKVWSSSYVLVAGGWSALLLTGFYLVIDVWKRTTWAQPFIWIGTNALTIYLVSHFVNFERLSAALAGGDVADWLDRLSPGLGGVVLATLGVMLCVLLCRFLHQRRIFLRL